MSFCLLSCLLTYPIRVCTWWTSANQPSSVWQGACRLEQRSQIVLQKWNLAGWVWISPLTDGNPKQFQHRQKHGKTMHFQNLPSRILSNVAFGSFDFWVLEPFTNNGCNHPYHPIFHDDCAMCCNHETEPSMLQMLTLFGFLGFSTKKSNCKNRLFNQFYCHT